VQGGDYARLLHDIIDTPLTASTGVAIVQDIGDERVGAAKLYAGRALSRGAIDVSSNSAATNQRLAAAGLPAPLQQSSKSCACPAGVSFAAGRTTML